jgi:hypothetical protein
MLACKQSQSLKVVPKIFIHKHLLTFIDGKNPISKRTSRREKHPEMDVRSQPRDQNHFLIGHLKMLA